MHKNHNESNSDACDRGITAEVPEKFRRNVLLPSWGGRGAVSWKRGYLS